MRLAILGSHPIQYYAPLFRAIGRRVETHVFYAHRATPEQQGAAGFGDAFDWDVDLTAGYDHSFLRNVAARPGVDHFGGCDTPEIGRRLAEGTFDALMVTGWNLKSSLQAIWAARRMGLPVIVRGDSQLATPRSTLKRLAKDLAYPALLRAFDAALYVGARSKAYYQHYRVTPERLFFSPHCVDNDWFAERAGEAARQSVRAEIGATENQPIVLFAGKLVPFKRPLDVIEACAASIAKPRVVVAGSGELGPAMAERARALGVQLTLLGFQNQSRMPAVYAAADVLMLPSDGRETWGLVCNEAMACGRPILVSDAAGCADDLAAGGRAGRLFPLADIAAAAQGLDQIISHPPTPTAIADHIGRYSLSAAANGVAAALEAVTAAGAISALAPDQSRG